MPTSLEVIQQKLQRRLLVLDSAFDRHLIEPKVGRRVDKFALQEGYVSALWQAWCSFCRELLIHSTQGTITRAGVFTTSPHSTLKEMEIAYIAKQLSNGRPVNNIRALSGSYQEHNWGDIAKLHLVATGIGCSNSVSILTGLSACIRLEDLQLCRNASAHVCKSTVQNVRASKVRYQNTNLKHPSDMIYWIDPANSNFLWKSWIEEIELAAQFSVA